LATRKEVNYYFNTGFGYPRMSARDRKIGLDQHVEKRWSKLWNTEKHFFSKGLY